MFGSKSVGLISNVSSGIDSSCSVRILGLEFFLLSLAVFVSSSFVRIKIASVEVQQSGMNIFEVHKSRWTCAKNMYVLLEGKRKVISFKDK